MSETRSKKPRLSAKRRKQQRREFLRTAGLAVGMVSASLFGLVPLIWILQCPPAPARCIEEPAG